MIIVRNQSSVKNLVQDLGDRIKFADLVNNFTQGGSAVPLSAEAGKNLGILINNINDEVGVRIDTEVNTLVNSIDSNVTTLNTRITTEVASLVQTDSDNLATAKAYADSQINAAKLALGTNYSVETITERDALVDLTLTDNVFVVNDGDNKWASYKVSNLSPLEFTKIMDQDIYLNSISKEAVKSAYESNDNTNEFSDAEKVKVGLVSVTASIDLDKVVQNDELNIDGTLATVSNTDIASSQAVKSFVNSNVTSVNDRITSEIDLLNTTITTKETTINGRIDDEVIALEQSDIDNLNAAKAYSDTKVSDAVSSIKVKTDKGLVITGNTFTTTSAPKDGVVFNDEVTIDNGDETFSDFEGVTFVGNVGTLVGANNAHNGKTLKASYIYIA